METLEAPRKSTSLSVKLEADIQYRLKSLASAQKRTTHYLMREAITKYLIEQEAQQRLTDAAMQSVAHYQKTGLHISQAELDAWVDSLATNMHTPIPVCHG